MKRTIAICIVASGLLAVILSPGFPWSDRIRHNLSRLRTKVKTRIAAVRGQQPRTMLVTGKLTGYGAQVAALEGARVIAAESTSGYSAMSDREGRFVLPHLTWYPGATYNLIIAADAYHLKRIELRAPPSFPNHGVLDAGELRFDDGQQLERDERLVRPMEYDQGNADYYLELFRELTASLDTDELTVNAVCRYVAGKLNYAEPAREFESPRQILERGSCYCSNLALAMAAITAAGEYPTQTVHLSDSPEHKHTHVVVEVYYGGRWHLYDPTYGVSFLNRDNDVANYKELRLDPNLVTAGAFSGLKPETIEGILEWMPKTYQSGFHQIYQVNNSAICFER